MSYKSKKRVGKLGGGAGGGSSNQANTSTELASLIVPVVLQPNIADQVVEGDALTLFPVSTTSSIRVTFRNAVIGEIEQQYYGQVSTLFTEDRVVGTSAINVNISNGLLDSLSVLIEYIP